MRGGAIARGGGESTHDPKNVLEISTKEIETIEKVAMKEKTNTRPEIAVTTDTEEEIEEGIKKSKKIPISMREGKLRGSEKRILLRLMKWRTSWKRRSFLIKSNENTIR